MDPNAPAFPTPVLTDQFGKFVAPSVPGMTLLQYASIAAMQGLLSSPDTTDATYMTIAKDAIGNAKALLAELDKKQP